MVFTRAIHFGRIFLGGLWPWHPDKTSCAGISRKRLLIPVTYFPTNLEYGFTLRVTGIFCLRIFLYRLFWATCYTCQRSPFLKRKL